MQRQIQTEVEDHTVDEDMLNEPPPVQLNSTEEKLEVPVLPKTSGAPDDNPPQGLTWLQDLCSVVQYDFQLGTVFYCVSCREGLHCEMAFEKDARHSGHRRLMMYYYKGLITVNCAEIESLGVSTHEIEQFEWSVPGISSSLFVFLAKCLGHAYKFNDLSEKVQSKDCAHCRALELQNMSCDTKIRFCSLRCKYSLVNSPWPKIIFPPVEPIQSSKHHRHDSLSSTSLPKKARE